MNYLAHSYLSFGVPGVLAGNLISDFVKGKKQYDYPPEVRKGIVLHRAIDSFTDEHAATARAKEVFRRPYRLYSGAFVDVVYDHFLANDQALFPDNGLLSFSQEVYNTLDRYTELFPTPFKMMFPYMKQQNWLYNYRLRQGIANSFEGVVRRAVYLTDSKVAFQLFERHYEELRSCYDEFFPSMRAYALVTLRGFDDKMV